MLTDDLVNLATFFQMRILMLKHSIEAITRLRDMQKAQIGREFDILLV